ARPAQVCQLVPHPDSRLLHPLSQLRSHLLIAVEHPGHRRRADTRRPGDVPQRSHARLGLLSRYRNMVLFVSSVSFFIAATFIAARANSRGASQNALSLVRGNPLLIDRALSPVIWRRTRSNRG